MNLRLTATLFVVAASLSSFGQFCQPSEELVCSGYCTKYRSGYFPCCATATVSATDATPYSPSYCCQFDCYSNFGCEYGGFDCPVWSAPTVEHVYVWKTGPYSTCNGTTGLCS